MWKVCTLVCASLYWSVESYTVSWSRVVLLDERLQWYLYMSQKHKCYIVKHYSVRMLRFIQLLSLSKYSYVIIPDKAFLHFRLNQAIEVSTVRHNRARLWAVGSASQTWRADVQSTWWCAEWENCQQAKRRLAGSSDFRRTMRQVPDSVTTNSTGTCRELYQRKRRSVRENDCMSFSYLKAHGKGHSITLLSCDNDGNNEDQSFIRYLNCLLSPVYTRVSCRLVLVV